MKMFVWPCLLYSDTNSDSTPHTNSTAYPRPSFHTIPVYDSGCIRANHGCNSGCLCSDVSKKKGEK